MTKFTRNKLFNICYDHFHNFLRLLDVLPNFTFTTSETMRDISTEQLGDSSNSPPQKRAKRQPEDNLQQLEATSINAARTDDNFIGAVQLLNQQSTSYDDTDDQQPLRVGIFNLILRSEEDCNLAPEENLEQNSAGLKSS